MWASEESDGGLKADKGASEVEDRVKIRLVIEQLAAAASRVKAVPGPAGRVHLVRLKVPGVLKVIVVSVNKTPHLV